jgi:hypothetical protein
MAKKPNIVRTTISLPADLKRRMDKVTEDVNWSALACQAFESKLVEIISKRKEKTMDDVIARLRESKRQDEGEAAKAGRAAGELWVRDLAEVAEIKRLKKMYEGVSPNDQWVLFDSSANDAYSAAEHLAFAVQPESDGDRKAAEDFWEMIIGDDTSIISDAAFMEGFFNGALELWEALESQL